MGKRNRFDKYVLFKDCHELTMDRFIAAVCDSDLEKLVKHGRAPLVVLEIHFQNLYNEFVDLRGDKNGAVALDLLKEIAYLSGKKSVLQECVNILRIRPVAEIVTELRQMGYSYAFDHTDKEAYEKDLKRVETSLKRTDSDIRNKQKELDRMKANESDGGGFKRSDFHAINTRLWKYMGSHIKMTDISVAEWCAMMRELDRYIEVANAQHNNLLKETANG